MDHLGYQHNPRSEQRIDEWGDDGALSDDQQSGDDNDDTDDWSDPQLLANPQKGPEFFDECNHELILDVFLQGRFLSTNGGQV